PRDATALGAFGLAANLAGHYWCGEVDRDAACSLGKYALRWRLGRITVAVENHFRRIYFGVQVWQRGDSSDRGFAVRGCEPLRRAVPHLGRKQAEPDFS